MTTNTAIVVGKVNAEPTYGYTERTGAMYCTVSVLWIQETSEEPVNHSIPVLCAGRAAELARAGLRVGSVAEFKGRLSARQGILSFVCTQLEIKS